jgi:plasmid replication initiation protein
MITKSFSVIDGGPYRLQRWLVAAALLGLAVSADSWAEGEGSAPRGTSTRAIVSLVVDYGDGVQKHFTQLEWRDGATVFDMMQAAMQHPRGIRVKYRGKGATLLVTQIDDQSNEAGKGADRNWIYRINGQIGERSAGICTVKRGDTVLWSFEAYQ